MRIEREREGGEAKRDEERRMQRKGMPRDVERSGERFTNSKLQTRNLVILLGRELDSFLSIMRKIY